MATRILLLTLMLVLPLSACGHAGESIDGQVLEYGTRAPIAGAIVAVRWNATWHTPWQSSTLCGHVETATTDANGRYHIPGWIVPPKGFNVTMGGKAEYLDVYKTGYEYYWWPAYFNSPDDKQHVLFVKPFTGTREELFKSIRISGVDCQMAGESRRSLIPLYQNIYERLNALAITKEEKFTANAFLNRIDAITLPDEEATRRDLERREKIRYENN